MKQEKRTLLRSEAKLLDYKFKRTCIYGEITCIHYGYEPHIIENNKNRNDSQDCTENTFSVKNDFKNTLSFQNHKMEYLQSE